MTNIKPVKAFEQIELVSSLAELEYIWDGIPVGSVGIITGVAKTGKTTFVEDLGISLAVGRGECLGRKLIGTPKVVLFMSLEESMFLRSRRGAKQLEELTEDELELFKENYYSVPEDFPTFINTEEDWNKIKEYIDAVNPDVLCIDSLTHMFKGKIEDSQSAQSFFQNFNKYIKKEGRTVIIIHHNIKGTDKVMTMGDIAGSRVISQEFEYAYGFGRIPNSTDNYSLMLYNKHVELDDKLYKYKINKNAWLHLSETLEASNQIVDGRIDNRNKELIISSLLEICSQDSQGSLDNSYTITSGELGTKFVETNTMSKDTMYKNIKILSNLGVVKKDKKGVYTFSQNSLESYV
jgi:KaiC/GvpD/RAD55 family RecA-like ATPase